MRSLSRIAIATALLATGVGGCNWQKMDDAVAKAPVLSIQAPSGFNADELGRLIVPMLPPDPTTGMSARFMFFSPGTFGGGLVELDAKGAAHVTNIPDTVVTAFMARPVRAAIALDANTVLLGTPDLGMPKRGDTWTLKILPGPAPTFTLEHHSSLLPADLGDLYWGLGLATGEVAGNPTFPETVVLSQQKITLLLDGSDSTRVLAKPASCITTLDGTLDSSPRFISPRAVAIADLLPGGASEIVVGVPTGNSQGLGFAHVMRVRATTVEEQMALGPIPNILECPVMLTAPVGTPAQSNAQFGVSVAVGDFDGDGMRDDLVVGAPPDRAFVFIGPLANGAVPVEPALPGTAPAVANMGIPLVVPPGSAATDFGLRVAAINYDGLPGDEIAVAAPAFPVGGQVSAGQIFIYKADGTLLATIADHQPQQLAWLGYDVAGVTFVAPACAKTGAAAVTKSLLLAGTKSEIFAYFGAPTPSSPDPRCR